MYSNNIYMYTVIESKSFKSKADTIWSELERLEFSSHLSLNPLEGDVIPNGRGLRKIRWSVAGKGKRGGVRIIYYNMLDDGNILLLYIYTKNTQSNIDDKRLNKLKGSMT